MHPTTFTLLTVSALNEIQFRHPPSPLDIPFRNVPSWTVNGPTDPDPLNARPLPPQSIVDPARSSTTARPVGTSPATPHPVYVVGPGTLTVPPVAAASISD